MPTTLPLAASMAVESWLRALKVKTRLENGSYRIASGRSPTFTLSSLFSVFRSKMVTVLSPPLLTKPRFDSGASATPWIPDRVRNVASHLQRLGVDHHHVAAPCDEQALTVLVVSEIVPSAFAAEFDALAYLELLLGNCR